MTTWVLKRDGIEVCRGTEFDCVRYIHRNHCYSVHHALTFEGYTLESEGSLSPDPT